MSSRWSEWAVVALALCLLAACEREQRELEESSGSATPLQTVALSPLEPGSRVTERTANGPQFEQQAYDVSQGQRLYEWFNCSGCHAHGGGAIGPALMDEQWIYGSEPEQIHSTIVEGRPNGMPSFGTRIPDRQVWQLVAYVRSLGGLAPDTVTSARRDTMYVRPRQQSLPKQEPESGNLPPSAQQ